MNSRFITMRCLPGGLLRAAPLTLALMTLLIAPSADAGEGQHARKLIGTWYLALDAGPFNPVLAGTFLSGVAHFHGDRTFMISDAGDFGADSFLQTFATPQYGVWRNQRMTALSARRFEGTALSLEAHKGTGEALGWNKVHFSIELVGDNHAEGTINVFFLPCTEAPPLPSPLTCPDPVANADSFMPASPPDVPFSLTRVVVGQ